MPRGARLLPAIDFDREPTVKMRFASLLLMSAILSMPAVGATPDWKEGVNYFLIENIPPSAIPNGKVEVVEVFSYGCPACAQFNPIARKLKASLPANAVFSYVPAAFRADEDWPMFQRAYCAAQLMGIAEKTHDAMFDAVWTTGELQTVDPATSRLRDPLPSIENAARFYNRHAGVKVEDFIATANSMTTAIKMREADAFIKLYQVDSTPTIVINRKYRTDARSAGGPAQMVDLVNWLVAKESKK